MDVKYSKWVKHYDTTKKPLRQSKLFTFILWAGSKVIMAFQPYKVEKINMEGLKPPYMILSNHMYFVDFMLGAMGTFPHRVNNVVNIDGY